MASAVMAEVSRLDLQGLTTPPTASITDVKHLASYNWIEASTPTIAVPGSPPLWSAPKVSRRVKKDSGLIYIAQNAARHPDSPLEPLFRALYVADPLFDIRSTDVVTDRNNIRKLLSFVDPGSTRFGLETFTIHIEVTKGTAIFWREETATQEIIRPHEFKGFGHEFEKASTTNQISSSTGHHRIIAYRFSDLNFIVRHETDAYVAADTRILLSSSKESENDNLASLLESLSLSQTNSPPCTAPTGSKLTVKEEGQPIEIQEVAPQLWVSQTPKLVRAYHRQGTFQVPEVEDVTGEIRRWEEANQRALRKLAALIRKLISVVKACGGNAVVKYDAQRDKLVLWKADRKEMLPEELYSKWEDKDNSEAETDSDHDANAESAVDQAGIKRNGKSLRSDDTNSTSPSHSQAEKASAVEPGPDSIS